MEYFIKRPGLLVKTIPWKCGFLMFHSFARGTSYAESRWNVVAKIGIFFFFFFTFDKVSNEDNGKSVDIWNSFVKLDGK